MDDLRLEVAIVLQQIIVSSGGHPMGYPEGMALADKIINLVKTNELHKSTHDSELVRE